MKTFTFKRLLSTTMCMLLGLSFVHAADGDLITEQITVKLDQAGTLPDKIAASQKYLITNLKVVGEINGTDVCILRAMTGCDENRKSTDGKLSTLDLSEAKIVSGGSIYFYRTGTEYTQDDVFGPFFFYGCRSLTSIKLPSGVTSIGIEAFYNCSGLTSIDIPESVTSIGDQAFHGCSSLLNVNIPKGVTSISDQAFAGCSSLASVNIPDGVTSIGVSAFGYSGLTSITIPGSVTSIGKWAFSGCSGLKSIHIPSSVSSIDNEAFKNCTSLNSIYLNWNRPIDIDPSVFTNVNATLYVPQESLAAYSASNWGSCFASIVEYDATGIAKAVEASDAKVVSRHSVNGQRLYSPAKGLNIVKYTDGTVRKVWVR